MTEFARGQRWLSESQPELGLGLVEGVEHRRVRMFFPATGARRTFATDQAPLARAVFSVGDAIRDQDGAEWVVTGLEEGAGLVTYQVRDTDGRPGALREAELDPRLRLNRPGQRLLAARTDSNAWFRLRLATWRQYHRAATSPVRGLIGARISPIPHQLYIAAEVAGRPMPRVLLADEVGLGKTIEAGLILHRLLRAGRVQRVLILVPTPLLHQWLVELLRRFNLSVALFDAPRLAEARDGNPFAGEQRVLCGVDSLLGQERLIRAVFAGAWDLLIVDEAHHLHWTPEGTSPAYDLVAGLAVRTPAVLLLTATPEQLGRAGHFGRLRLLDPDRFGDYEAFLAEEEHYAPVAALAGRLLDGTGPTEADGALLTELLGEQCAASGDMDKILAALLDRHGTSRVMFRNTRAAIAGFPERRMHPTSLSATGCSTLWPEREWGEDGALEDPRLAWLIDTLKALRPAKVLLITAQAGTVLALRRALASRAGIQAAVFHEGMEIVERDRAAAWFAADEDGTQLLICSEIGSEGRNFQFVHHLILFDLPLLPDLLEQRIGRLDRIGQTRTIELHVPYLAGGPGEWLFRWYAEGLAAFTAPAPAGTAVYERLGARLHALLGLAPPTETLAAREAVPEEDDIDRLVGDAAELRSVLGAALAAGRDRLLEQSSHRPAAGAALVDAMRAEDQDPELRDYLHRFWDAFGIEHEPGRGGSTVLRPGAHMLEERFGGLPEDGLTVCFDRAHALAHEDQAFLTREHPLVRSAMDYLTSRTLGTSAIWLTRDARFPAGSLLLEIIAVADCPAPPALAVERFLPPTLVRLLLDEQGRTLAETLDPDALPGRCLHTNQSLATALVRARATIIQRMLAAAEPTLAGQLAQVRADAQARMRRELAVELERLAALAAVNPSVHPQELIDLDEHRAHLDLALSQARLRLDAIRLVAFT